VASSLLTWTFYSPVKLRAAPTLMDALSCKLIAARGTDAAAIVARGFVTVRTLTVA